MHFMCCFMTWGHSCSLCTVALIMFVIVRAWCTKYEVYFIFCFMNLFPVWTESDTFVDCQKTTNRFHHTNSCFFSVCVCVCANAENDSQMCLQWAVIILKWLTSHTGMFLMCRSKSQTHSERRAVWIPPPPALPPLTHAWKALAGVCSLVICF